MESYFVSAMIRANNVVGWYLLYSARL